jgi:hypothetical protein
MILKMNREFTGRRRLGCDDPERCRHALVAYPLLLLKAFACEYDKTTRI